MALMGKRRLFVDFYLGVSAGNATDAARRAGYKHPEAEGYRLLRDEGVKAAVEESLAAVGIRKEQVLLRLREQAFADLGSIIGIEAGVPVLRLERDTSRDTETACAWPPQYRLAGQSYLLKSVSFSRAHGIRVELHDPQRALLMLGKYLGLWSGEAPDEGDGFGDLARAIMESARAARGKEHGSDGER